MVAAGFSLRCTGLKACATNNYLDSCAQNGMGKIPLDCKMKASKNLDDARATLSAYKELRKHMVKPASNYLVDKPNFELDYFKESVLYRFIELAEATFALLDVGNYLGAITTVRSLQETSCVMCYINELCQYVVENKELTHFTEGMHRLILGWKNDDEFPEPLNVLTLINKVDKKISGYRKYYDILSEYVHPNWHGTMGLFARTGGKKLKVELGRYIRGKKILIKHIENALIISIDLLRFIESQYEDIVKKFVDTCHCINEKGELKNQIQPAWERAVEQ
jgi:hypothetical protein